MLPLPNADKKTDHCGLSLSAGKKLHPSRHQVQMRDLREYRKRDLFSALAEED